MHRGAAVLFGAEDGVARHGSLGAVQRMEWRGTGVLELGLPCIGEPAGGEGEGGFKIEI